MINMRSRRVLFNSLHLTMPEDSAAASADTAAIQEEIDCLQEMLASFLDITTTVAPLPPVVTIDDSSPFELLVTVAEPASGSAPFSNYTVTLDFGHVDQAGRQDVLTGATLADPATALTGYTGTIGSFTIDSALADLYGDITIEATCEDSTGAVLDSTAAGTTGCGKTGVVKSTDFVPEGATNLYFTEMRVLATALAGYVAGAGTISATDTLLEALQKLDGNIQSVDLTALIDDVAIVDDQVWSSQQTDKAITDAFSAFVGGSPALLDTWLEVVAEIQDNDSDIATAITDIAHNTQQADLNTSNVAVLANTLSLAENDIDSLQADILILLQRIADNAAAIAALKTSAWENSDGSIADQSSTDIEFNAGTVKLGDYADGNNEITNPTGLYSRESDGTMKIITIENLASLMGLTPPVVIEGFVITGQTLSISNYGGVGGPTDGHQWYADGLPIVGASGTTYTITTVDEGSKITVKVNGEESNELSNFFPAYINPEVWFDPSQSLAGELVNAGTGDIATLNSGAEQPLAIYNGMPVNHMKGQTYTLPDQFNGAAESLTFVTTWLENVRTNNSVFRLNQVSGTDRSQMHIPWSNGIVYFDIQGMDDRFATNIGDAGQVLLASYQNNPTDATATIYRSGDPDPTSPYSITIPFNSASPTATGAIFGEGAVDHYMLDTIISSAELSATAKEKLEGYVAWKYNMPEILSATHPYKLAPA